MKENKILLKRDKCYIYNVHMFVHIWIAWSLQEVLYIYKIKW
jgi:hypothetical protein